MTLDVLLTLPIMVFVVLMTAASSRQVIKSRSVEGIALPTTVLSLYAALSWIAYGTITGNAFQVSACSLAAMGFITILTVAHRTGDLHAAKVFGGMVAYGSFAAGLAALMGISGLGIAVSLLTLANRLPQTVKAWRKPGGEGISAVGAAFDSSQCLLWGVMGIVNGDIWLTLCSLYAAANAGFVSFRTALTNRSTNYGEDAPTFADMTAAA